MTEFVLLALAAGAAILAYKTGIEVSRKQVLDDFTQRIASTIGSDSEFSAKFGVRGGYLAIDYFPEGSRSGTGYNSHVDGIFLIVERDQFVHLISGAKGVADTEA